MLRRSLRTLDALERSARDEHLHLLSLFGSAAQDAWLLEGLRLERAHLAKLVRLATEATRQVKALEKRVRAKMRRRSRALWRLVRKHVLLRRVAWYWFELPSRSTCFETQRGEAIESFQREWNVHQVACVCCKVPEYIAVGVYGKETHDAVLALARTKLKSGTRV
jgi:hypothetical protein